MKPTIPGRLHAHGLVDARLDSAAEVVRHLGCVQSQLHDMALWAVARRMTGEPTLADLQDDFAAGTFWRTHVLRPTWHLVDPDDLHWLLSLTGPRVERLVRSTNRTIGLTDDVVERGVAVIATLVADGSDRTRGDLATALGEAGLDLTGQAVAHVAMQAEIEALVVNGPMQGKQHTYRALPPRPVTESRDELLARVARRYATGHGAFRDRDLAWWTSLTLGDSRRAVELGGLTPLAGHEGYWQLEPPVDADVPRATLLSNFDEYISYARDPDDYAGFAGTAADVMRGSGLLLVDGRLAGTWTRTVTARRVDVVVDATPRVTADLRRALVDEVDRFGRFLQREPALALAPT